MFNVKIKRQSTDLAAGIADASQNLLSHNQRPGFKNMTTTINFKNQKFGEKFEPKKMMVRLTTKTVQKYKRQVLASIQF